MEQKLVLIVENGMMNRPKISASLNRSGYDVQFASDAATALTIFNHTRPFLILVSLIMLKVDSRTFSRIIKNDEDTKDITIVGFSDVAQTSKSLFYAGFDGFINMTESNSGLLKNIKTYLTKTKK